ncbi:MAG: phosphoribosyltransferase [Stappia sp.]|uniref:ComF family protein n=1 Tax=Stappia sp. TaxID=1870903 RepID=UPI000C57E8EE|nr:ComF family protein [Stappia sp.]MAA98487.1 phosphoribosyltransferase [Stappia sp.]MBM21327.1 phosphoribosyltransferase [Stappia sp.]
MSEASAEAERQAADRGGKAQGLLAGFGRVLQAGRNAGVAAFSLALPPTCPSCDRLIAGGEALCPRCWAETPFLAPPWCERLGVPFAYDLGEGAVSPSAIARPPVFGRLRSVAAHDGPARILVSRLKYHDHPFAARMMGRWMARVGAELLAAGAEEAGPPLVVPVPLHRLRHWSRRYNQAALLARHAAQAAGAEVAPFALARRRATKRQVGLDAAARARNVRGAFVATRDGSMRMTGRRVVLVDDVYTTGATVEAAARAVLRGGAASVDVLTFAHAGAETPIG